MQNRLGLLYGILVTLLLVMGVWWVYYLTQQGQVQAEYRKQKLATEHLHAAYLLQSDPRVRENPRKVLGEAFPHLIVHQHSDGVHLEIDPVVLQAIDDEARTARNMFLYEGLFFLVLLGGGTTILTVARRNEKRFKQTRELFLAGATHEFKTPLASLKLYTETLGREGLQDADRSRIRGAMIDDVKRLEGLIDDMLAISAADAFAAGPASPLDLAEESRAVVEDLVPYAKAHGARLRLTTEMDCIVLGHQLTFSLALRNLIVNAIKHSPESVRVDVSLKHGTRRHQVIVCDDGPGIARHLQKKVFDCFYSQGQGDRSGVGAGLGLYLVRRNIETLGGKVTLSSTQGTGSTFTLSLPASRVTVQGDAQ